MSPDDSSRNVTEQAKPTHQATGGAVTIDVERALADALSRAAAAGRFDVVAQLARELEARRLARAGNVVRLDDERKREKGK